jgi:type I restriction enzyme S subunit
MANSVQDIISAIGWVKNIPQGWSMFPAKSILMERKQLSESGEEDYLSVSEYSGITRRKDKIAEDEFISRADSLEGYKIVRKNDLVMNIMLAWKRGLGVSPFDGIVSPAYASFSFNKGYPPFFHYLFRSDIYVDIFRLFSYGVIPSRWRLYPEVFLSLPILFPPLPIQQSIASFLDSETSRIDALISKKQRQIELLLEKRRAIITKAVTKGLDLNAKMKDSGVEWVGEIPANWQIRKLKTLCELITKGTTPSTIGKEVTEEGTIRFVKAENIASSNKLELQPSFFIDQETNSLLSRSIIRENDLLFVIAGATIGKTAVATSQLLPANTNQAVCIVRLMRSECVEYVHYFLQSALVKTVIQLRSVQSAQPNISMQDIGDFYLPYPPIEIQRTISHDLVSATATIDTMRSKISISIDLLIEHRSSLITAAVSGQTDVSKLKDGAK